jgi:hypothetical protein
MPRFQNVGDVCTFLRWQRKYPISSSAAFGKIGDAYLKAVYGFAEANHIPVVHFKKGEKKEETARPYLEAAAREGKARVVLIGVAQEKASIWKSWPRKGQEEARHPHMDWDREMAYNQIGSDPVQSFFGRWWRRLPSPFTDADVHIRIWISDVVPPIRGCRHLCIRPSARRPNVV